MAKLLAGPLNLLLDETICDAALTGLNSHPVDGYDIFIIEELLKAKILQVITDDGDFSVVTGLRVFTANRAVIRAAQTQGKICRR